MSNREAAERHTMSLRGLNYLMAFVALVSSVLLLFTAQRVQKSYDTMIAVSNRYVELQSAAYDLQRASDYLTDQVRSFVITGDLSFLENYFEEATVTRRRENAVEVFVGKADNEAALAELRGALRESMELMNTEYSAMRLTAIAYRLDLSQLPEAVQNATLISGYLNMPPSAQSTYAKELVNDFLYTAKKSEIYSAMGRCLDILVHSQQEQQTLAGEELSEAFFVRRVVEIVLFASVLAIIAVNALLVIKPMLKNVKYIREGKPLPVAGADELRFLARTYNDIYLENQKHEQELSYRITHDPLTGVYNRNGYTMLLGNEQLSEFALLLADVDRFKTVNDTHGHGVGDRVLAKAARTLLEHFSEDDAVCRVGGDEFALFICDASEADEAALTDKIRAVNELLLHPDDGLPPVSLSVGGAFVNNRQGVDTLAKKADVALYHVKENGRCGCAFYAPTMKTEETAHDDSDGNAK